MYMFFFFQVSQPGIEPGHPHIVYPDDVNHNIIGHVGHPIYDVNEVLFIYHTLLTLDIHVIYEIFNIHIRYIVYIHKI